MSTFKCKMCGGTLEIQSGSTVAECEYCGAKQTLPKLDDDRRASMYDRANHFRRNNEFDKAMGIYEQILNEDITDAEAYWSLVLCRYGIEYVEDPSTHKRVPTVNRAQFTSIFDDDNYRSALQYADGYQRLIYEAEAQAINEIQKGILAISSKESPFDIFICYKETDNSGRRTPDSVLAQDLYYQLKQEGFKVFFARITLEDKLGSAYEPYIFAALNSAKVMVALGTKPEYFNAVWVKNEWSRYLALVKQSAGARTLIPAYRDMDPYDLPEEFSHLQAQDMSKLGFMQDLVRGIRKLIPKEEGQSSVQKPAVVSAPPDHTTSLLKRAFMFLEDEDWEEADAYAEKVLDLDPENGKAYLVKFLAELELSTKERLWIAFDKVNDNVFTRCIKSANYQKAIRFDKQFAAEAEQHQEKRCIRIYEYAVKMQENAADADDYIRAKRCFEGLGDFRDACERVKDCERRANALEEEECVERRYRLALALEREGRYSEAAEAFSRIPHWRDARQRMMRCNELLEQKSRRIRIISVAVLTAVVLAVIIIIFLLGLLLSPHADRIPGI